MKNKNRVLMIDTAPMLFDGITAVMYNYIANMNRDDIVIDVVAINKLADKQKQQFLDLGCEVFELTCRNRNPLKYIFELSSLVRKGKYAIAHIHCNSHTAAIDAFACRLGGCKVCITHSHNTKTAHAGFHKALGPLFNILTTDCFACGVEAGKWLHGERKTKVWKNAINTEKFAYSQEARNRLREQYQLNGKTAIGHVAHFTPHKNHEFLIDIWKDVVERNPNYILFLIGDGRLRQIIEDKVRALNLQKNVIFTGLVLNVQDYLSAMDVMILPSLYEGLPYVLIEWQDSGIPCLVADTVTPDCKLTDDVEFLPLSKDVWVEKILSCRPIDDRKAKSLKNQDLIKNSGYSIVDNAQKLKEFYLSK